MHRLYLVDVTSVAVFRDNCGDARPADPEVPRGAVDDRLDADGGAAVPFLSVAGDSKRLCDFVPRDFLVFCEVDDFHFSFVLLHVVSASPPTPLNRPRAWP